MFAQGGLRLHGIALAAILAFGSCPQAEAETAVAQNDVVTVTATGDGVLAVRTNGPQDFDVIVAGEASIATISLEAQPGHTLHSPQKPVKLPHADISDPITRNEFDYDCPSTLNGDEEPGQGKVRRACIKVDLFKDNTTWTSASVLGSPPVHLFTGDIVGGIEISGPGSATVQAKIWSSDDAANTETITLTETSAGSGVYRNTGTDAWPHFWKDHEDANKRFKVIDEDGELHVIPIIDGTEVTACEQSEKVDAAEVAAVDGTESLDSAEVYGDLTGGTHPWCGIALYDDNNNKAQGTGAKCVELGAKVDFLNVSGHSHTPTVGITGNDGFGLMTDNFDPSDIGTAWDDGELEWCLLAACSQVHVDESSPNASDFGILWIKAMPNVHALLGYRSTAPSGGVDVNIANDFCANLLNDHVHIAWMLANRPNTTTCPGRFATALVNVNNLDDKMYTLDYFPTKDDPGSQYRYYWIERNGNPITGYTYQIVYTTIMLP